ncbi:solute carrier family 23 member 2 [Elysia marginata]|uniref:Solute carrier family 23 member 2 n=1 Tax=Elysia marginata TaxID=1093978 RepID=A0AAV4GUC2_9GAST|nr:solute carrier family 23 member 2 [Elysia marginata]
MSNAALELRRKSNGSVSTNKQDSYNELNPEGSDDKVSFGRDDSQMPDSEDECPHKAHHNLHLVKSLDGGPPVLEVEDDEELKPLHYRVSDVPPAHLLVMSAWQQALINISTPLSITLVVAEVVCSQKDEVVKQQLLNASMFMVGMSTFVMSTFGVRLPIFQGPAPGFLIPLLAMSNFPEWKCPNLVEGSGGAHNGTVLLAVIGNNTMKPARDIILTKIAALSGSLMAVGVMHFLIGATGLVGVLIRYIGPLTISPTITMVGLNLFPVVVKFIQPSMLVTCVTFGANVILALFLANNLTPIPFWTRARGFHVVWFPLHQMFSVLITILIGWAFSGVLTTVGFFTDDPTSNEFLARTDAKSSIISEAPFFDIPYPGKIAGFSFSAAAFFNFVVASLLSVFDSIGDYSACAKTSRVTPPPKFAFNRGIAVEGLATIMSGSLGTCHATVSYGGSIGAIGITGVASRRVFQLCGLIFVFTGVLGKVGAFFLTIPLPVLGASSLFMSGVFIGLAISYLEVRFPNVFLTRLSYKFCYTNHTTTA